jgi:uncharacterized protein YjbJ (UPF0337 family)
VFVLAPSLQFFQVEPRRHASAAGKERTSQMTSPTTDKTEGKFDQAKGKVKEGLGNLADDNRTKGEGMLDQAKGKAKEGMGDAKDKANEAMDKVKSNS